MVELGTLAKDGKTANQEETLNNKPKKLSDVQKFVDAKYNKSKNIRVVLSKVHDMLKSIQSETENEITQKYKQFVDYI